MSEQREFDLVLFGATGFTGRLVAEYLLEIDAPVRWALAGRSKAKLEAVVAELAARSPKARSLPLLIGDALDPTSVRALVGRTRVVCTTVGPYDKYGLPIVEACANAGVHYCDLTGETQFIRKSIDRAHAAAIESGARIVHCCGFDSIPSDLGTFMLAAHFAAKGDRLAEAHLRVKRATGGVSGGTIASMLNLMETLTTPEARRAVFDPYSLYPIGTPRGRDGRDLAGVARDAENGRWLAPFVMAAINARVVRRSNALLGFPYGEDFRYDETTDMGRGAGGLLRASAFTAGLGAFTAAAATGPGRKLLGRFLPAPGEGPTREARERGGFRIEILAKGKSGARATGVVIGRKDPGYGETAKMLSESALCLANDALGSKGGVLTPASAMGDALLARLRAAGMTFEVEAA